MSRAAIQVRVVAIKKDIAAHGSYLSLEDATRFESELEKLRTQDQTLTELEATRRLLADLEAQMPPIDVYPFGHVRLAAEYGRLKVRERQLLNQCIGRHPQ